MRWDGLLLEFRFQYLDDFLCLFQLQVGTGGDLFDGQFQHALGRVAAAGFQGVDHPAVDLVSIFESRMFRPPLPMASDTWSGLR